MLTIKKRFLVGACMFSYLLLNSHKITSVSISLPTEGDVILFKAITPKIVTAIPDRVLNPASKDKLRQVIIAGSDVFELAIAIESGKLTSEFKEELNAIRREFKVLNARLKAESDKIQALKAKLKNASSAEEKSRLIEEQTLVILDMLDGMSDPMFNVSVAFQKLNSMLVAKLLQVLELIPPIQPYLTVGSGKDQIALSKFMGVKLIEMKEYTKALKRISRNLKLTFNELRADMLKCKNDITKSYQSVRAQKKLLPESELASPIQPEPVQNEPILE